MFFLPLSVDNDFNSSRYRTLSSNLFNSPRFLPLVSHNWEEIEKEFQDFYQSRGLLAGRNFEPVATSTTTSQSSTSNSQAKSNQAVSVFDQSFEDAFFKDFFQYRENKKLGLAQNQIANPAKKPEMNPLVIQTNIGSMSPGSISVKIENNILTISGEEKTATGFSKFNSARTLPPYIATHNLEDQIISKLNTSSDGVKMLEIILPEEPKPAIEDEEKNFKSDEIKIQIVGSKKEDSKEVE